MHTSVASVKGAFLILVLVNLAEESRDDAQRIIVGVLSLLGEAFEEVGLWRFGFLGDPVRQWREYIACSLVLGLGLFEKLVD